MDQLSEGTSTDLSARGQLIISRSGRTCRGRRAVFDQVEPEVRRGGARCAARFVNATRRGGSLQSNANISSLLFLSSSPEMCSAEVEAAASCAGKGRQTLLSAPPAPAFN